MSIPFPYTQESLPATVDLRLVCARVSIETDRKPYPHTSAYTPLIDRCRFSVGNRAAAADGVWKHNLHPEFRHTVKLSLAACLAAGDWPWWRNAKGQWHSVEREAVLGEKRRISFFLDACVGFFRLFSNLPAMIHILNSMLTLLFYTEKHIFRSADRRNKLFQIGIC